MKRPPEFAHVVNHQTGNAHPNGGKEGNLPRKRWIKLWSQEWIGGTTRREMEPDERSVWADFLALAGDSPDPGKICFYPGVSVTDDQLCKTLKISQELLNRARDKMLAFGKIEINSDIVHITNWQKYQGEYEKLKSWRDERKLERQNESSPNSFQMKDKMKVGTRPDQRKRGGEGKNKDIITIPKGRRKQVASPEVKDILSKISERVNYQIPNYAKEGMAVKRALNMSFTPEQFMACWEKMKTFRFWVGQWLPLAKVTENLGEFVAGRLKEASYEKIDKRRLPTQYTDPESLYHEGD